MKTPVWMIVARADTLMKPQQQNAAKETGRAFAQLARRNPILLWNASLRKQDLSMQDEPKQGLFPTQMSLKGKHADDR